MHPRILPLAVLSAALLLTGCFGALSSGEPVIPYAAYAEAEHRHPAEFALLVKSTSAFRTHLPVEVAGLPEGWLFESEVPELTVDGGRNATVIVRVEPPEDAPHGPTNFRVRVGDGVADLTVNVRDLGAEPARPGVGVQVISAGFWDNGTVFWTNMKEVRDSPRLYWWTTDEGDKADEYMEPLKVYVGGARGERPPEPYNSSGYVPVIRGFDERLRGMAEGQTLAVRIPPEKAYTLPGNEDHFLYGDWLNFLITVKSVDVLERDDSPCAGLPVECPPPGD